VLGCWLLGGLVALAGAFIYAELAARRPHLVGGQYAYLREAYHPAVAFVYGRALLLVVQTGGMAGVAVTFAHYFCELTGLTTPPGIVAAATLGVLTLINCFGVKAGATTQNILMVLKIAAILALVVCALVFVGTPQVHLAPLLDRPRSFALVAAFAAAMSPVMFSYGGWHTASFVTAEMKRPERDLSRGLLIGVGGVVALYLAANIVYLGALGASGLAGTTTPASAVMRIALGERGARLIAVGITISTLGFLSQSILTAPRVYFAMAEDRVFFKSVAMVSARSRVPVVAIVLQGIWAAVIALSNRYDQIVSYVVSVDFIAYGLTATCLLIFRYRDRRAIASLPATPTSATFTVPGRPLTTLFFTAVCWAVVAGTIYADPEKTRTGLLIVLAGVPVYFFWRWWRRNG